MRGRLWRRSNPALFGDDRQRLVDDLMTARRDVKARHPTARARVHAAKVALGERGPVWWTDGAPDLTRRMAKNTPYADWYAQQTACPDPRSGPA